MFDIVPVDSRNSDAPEQLGTKTKFWFKNDAGRRLLFKAEERGTGEDWAEKIACEICKLLGLPHVHYELAHDMHRDVPGVICANCAARPGVLILANQLLLERDPAYPADGSRKYKVHQHSIDAIVTCLQELKPPSKEWMTDVPSNITTALDVFVGYLLLDALIANQDRHHQNWGVVRLPDGDHLAPTFDHGSALARNLSDEERYDRLQSLDKGRQLPHFSTKARSAIYEDVNAAKPMPTLNAATGFAKLAPESAKTWGERLATLDEKTITHLFEEVPTERMSQITREFSVALLLENRRRILGALNL